MPAYEGVRGLVRSKKRGAHLVVAYLVLHPIFPQKRIELDHIRILWDITAARNCYLSKGEEGRGKTRTVASYSFPVPSKHSIIVRGFRFAGVAAAGVEEDGAVAIAEEWGATGAEDSP